jgi:hypothetical protein
MSLQNLESRYKERTKQLYAGATSKFDGGRPSRGANDDPLIVRRPGDGYFGGASRLLGRFLPASSAAQDVKRITLFTLSTRGIAFLAKQALLQTGNTFAKTRVLNPTFAVANAIPFLRVERNLDISNPGNAIKGALGITAIQDLVAGRQPLSNEQLRLAGQLQMETYSNLLPGGGAARKLIEKIPFVSQLKGVKAAAIGQEIGRPEIGDGTKEYFVARLGYKTPPSDDEVSDEPEPPVSGFLASSLKKAGNFLKRDTIAAAAPGTFKYGGKVTTDNGFSGQKYGAIAQREWNGVYTTYMSLSNGSDTSFPWHINNETDYNQFSSTRPTRGTDRAYQRGSLIPAVPSDGNYRSTSLGDEVPTQLEKYTEATHLITELRNQQVKYTLNTPLEEEGNRQYLRYFTPGTAAIQGIIQFDDTDASNSYVKSQNAEQLANGQRETRNKVTYIKDPANLPTFSHPTRPAPYRTLPGKNTQNEWEIDDPVIVAFQMSNNTPVQFRAFITDLKQSVSPTYKEYQYVGRIEKFVNFTTVQRKITFNLEVIAFSKDELQTVWSRINYLTGLAFPYGINKGILQPNIVKLTIGNVFVDQPGYITSLNTDFKEKSWDIDRDKQVPIGANVSVDFTIIEKVAARADSPFYGIMEPVVGQPSVAPATQEQEPPTNQSPDAQTNEETVVEERVPQFTLTEEQRRVLRGISPSAQGITFTGFGGGGGFSGGGSAGTF